MAYTLLTGVTGLLGRYLVKDLLLAGQPIAVLVRPTRRANARQRVENVMAYWDEHLERTLPRPVVLDGDITEPDLGLDARAIRWVAEHCDTMLHNAASLSFISTGPTSEPWRSNVEGTKNVLELCKNAQIRKFHHVSTSYVCGLRNGRILESELDVGQQLSNDYEQSKVQAEKMVRSADFIDTLTVFRPAIIVGDSHTGYTTTYHGFYAPVQVVYTMVQNLVPNETGRAHSLARFALTGNETKNLVPVDWVSEVMAHVVSHPEHHGKTYHLTPWHPTTVRLMGEVIEQATGFYGVTFVGPDSQVEDYTDYEVLFRDMVKVYNSYWRDDPTFDSTNTMTAAPHLPCPHVDRQMLLRMANYAIGVNFDGPRTKPLDPDFDSHRVLDPLVEAMHRLKELPDPQPRLGLQITGPGGGQWHLLTLAGRVVGADVGIDANCSATMELDVDTFASLAHGHFTADQAFSSGRLHITGNGLPKPKLLRILQDIACHRAERESVGG